MALQLRVLTMIPKAAQKSGRDRNQLTMAATAQIAVTEMGTRLLLLKREQVKAMVKNASERSTAWIDV